MFSKLKVIHSEKSIAQPKSDLWQMKHILLSSSKARRWQTKAKSNRSTLTNKSHSWEASSLMTQMCLFRCPFSFRKRRWDTAALQAQFKPKKSSKEKHWITNNLSPVLSQTCKNWTRTFGKDTLSKRKNMLPFATVFNQVWCRKRNSTRLPSLLNPSWTIHSPLRPIFQIVAWHSELV